MKMNSKEVKPKGETIDGEETVARDLEIPEAIHDLKEAMDGLEETVDSFVGILNSVQSSMEKEEESDEGPLPFSAPLACDLQEMTGRICKVRKSLRLNKSCLEI